MAAEPRLAMCSTKIGSSERELRQNWRRFLPKLARIKLAGLIHRPRRPIARPPASGAGDKARPRGFFRSARLFRRRRRPPFFDRRPRPPSPPPPSRPANQNQKCVESNYEQLGRWTLAIRETCLERFFQSVPHKSCFRSSQV